jgi:iron complex transport system ATP-binding protein
MIELENVSIGYGPETVLYDITLKAVPGELLGLIGPNASGKSTLIKGITGIISHTTGNILIGGRNIKNIKRNQLARLLAVVPQSPVLPDAFTAFETVLMGRTPHLGLLTYEGHKDRTIAWNSMKATKSNAIAARRVGQLSGGERQRVVIARALTQQPRAILLDEPTSHLDISYQVEICRLVKQLCKSQNLTVIMALHDLNLASQFCDRLLMLNKGRIFAEGVPAKVLTVENIKAVYGTNVMVCPHPVNKLPTTLITAD